MLRLRSHWSLSWRRLVRLGLIVAIVSVGVSGSRGPGMRDANASTDRVAHAAALRSTSAPRPACGLLRRVLRHDYAYRDAVLAGDATVPILVSVAPAETTALTTAIETAGGKALKQDDVVGYVRATLPTAAFPQIACQHGVDAIEVDAEFRQWDVTLPSRAFGQQLELGHPWVAIVSPPSSDPAGGRLPTSTGRPPITFPLGEMGVDRFQRDHPTFDGRGVTIGLIEWMPDMLEPGLWQTADGQPKVLRPLFDWSDPPSRFLVRLTEGTASHGVVTIGGQRYRVPQPLEQRRVMVGSIDEREHPYFDRDLNRDGNPDGSDPVIGVLRDPESNRMWIDIHQNRDFTDDRSYQCGDEPLLVLGTDKPETLARESQGILVLCDAAMPAKALFVPTANRHATGVGAIAAGTRFPLGGRGVAPGARLLPILLFDARVSTFIEAHLRAFRDPRVQIVNVGLASTRRLHDGRSVTGLVLDRAVRRHGKLAFSSGGNGPSSLEAVAEAANSTEVISVGAFASSKTLDAVLGTHVAEGDPEFWLGALGPRADGRLKPDLLASGAGFVPTSSAHFERGTNPAVVPPAGGRASWGTSYSSPAAAGAAAVLLSAARQSGFDASADDVKAALILSARRLPGYSLSKQGAGLLSLPDAWRALRRHDRFLRVDVRAPVSTVMTRDGDVAPSGPGLFEREGWTTADIGRSQTRVVRLTRREGTAAPMRVALRLLGDRETFAAPSSAELPLDRPVDVPVRITPRTAGNHDAVLLLTDAATGRLHAHIPLTIVVATEAPTVGAGPIRLTGEVGYPATGRQFIRLPETPASLTWNLSLSSDERVIVFLVNPAGIHFPYYADFQRRSWRYTLDGAEPGVWELVINHMHKAIEWDPLRPVPEPVRYTLTLTSTATGSPRSDLGPQQTLAKRPDPAISRVVDLAADVPFTAEEFYVARDGATLEVTAAKAPDDSCTAEYQVLLQRCEQGRCSTLVGSMASSVDAHVSARTVQAGAWRAVVWRTTPAPCPQQITVRIAITRPAPEPETATR